MEPEPLDLRDIHLPEPVDWWPPAPGWWALLALVLLAVAAFLWWRRRHRRLAWYREARAELERVERLSATGAIGCGEALRALSTLLRRVALLRDGRERVAGMHGKAWLAWLDRSLPEQGFQDGPGRVLATAPYRADAEADLPALFALVRRWLDVQRRESGR